MKHFLRWRFNALAALSIGLSVALCGFSCSGHSVRATDYQGGSGSEILLDDKGLEITEVSGMPGFCDGFKCQVVKGWFNSMLPDGDGIAARLIGTIQCKVRYPYGSYAGPPPIVNGWGIRICWPSLLFLFAVLPAFCHFREFRRRNRTGRDAKRGFEVVTSSHAKPTNEALTDDHEES